MANSYTAVVEDANCVQIGQNESIVGGVVGGGVGAVGGALVGSLFGKSGKKWGALAGGLGGAAYGASGDKVYNCTILTTVGGERVMVSKQSSAIIQRGAAVTVVKQNNQWLAM
jgi:outer membrane lipoprotein SlyB